MKDILLSINIGFSFVIWFVYISLLISMIISKMRLKEDFQNFVYSNVALLSIVFLYLANLAFAKSYNFIWFLLSKYLVISLSLFVVPIFVRVISNNFIVFERILVFLYSFVSVVVIFCFLSFFLLSIHSTIWVIVIVVMTFVFIEFFYFYFTLGRSLRFDYFLLSFVVLFLPSNIVVSIFYDFYNVSWFEFLMYLYFGVLNFAFAYVMISKVLNVYREYVVNLEDFSEKIEKEEKLYKWFVVFLISILEARDPYTRGHSERVARYSYNLAKLWYKNTYMPNFIEIGALLHDIGKVGVRDEVLFYQGKLDEDMKKEMKEHPRIGKELLSVVDLFKDLSDIAYMHHEKLDGSGYPLGLNARDIPEYVRIVTIADSFDAMNSSRVYRKNLDAHYILNEFERCKGVQFDPKLSEFFVKNVSRVV